MKGKVKK